MSDIADGIIEGILGGYYPEHRKPKSWQSGSGDFKWRTKEGDVIDMREMETSHLQNCARMCERNGNTGKLKQLRTVLQERK